MTKNLYLFVAVYLIFIFFAPSSSDEDSLVSADDPLDRYYFWINVLAWGIILIVPVYALNIYPYLPQQVGGGKIIKADVITSDELSGLFSIENTDVYVLDHISKGTIFLVINNDDGSRKIVEVAEAQIKSVIYELPTPVPPLPTITITPQPTDSPTPSPTTLPAITLTP